jgi:hypothetical protein
MDLQLFQCALGKSSYAAPVSTFFAVLPEFGVENRKRFT